MNREAIRNTSLNWVLDASILYGIAHRNPAVQAKCDQFLRELRKAQVTSPRVLVFVPRRFRHEVKNLGARQFRVYQRRTLQLTERQHGTCAEAHFLRQKEDWDYVAVALARQSECRSNIAIATRDRHFKVVEEKLSKKSIVLCNPTSNWEELE